MRKHVSQAFIVDAWNFPIGEAKRFLVVEKVGSMKISVK